jgi:uncharacterized protein
MLTSPLVPGAPAWIDLGTPDPETAAAFYGALLGWELEPAGPSAGGYGMFTLNGKTVSGIGAPTDGGMGSSWTVHFHTTDADATADTVREAGGTVHLPPTDVGKNGRTAGFTDPGGARFAVWQPRQISGLELVTALGSLCWTELRSHDRAAATEFYHQVFGWQSKDTRFAGMPCSLLAPAKGGQGTTVGGIVPLFPEQTSAGMHPHWLPWFEVVDCDAAVEIGRELGGRIVRSPSTTAGIGRSAQLVDGGGATFAVVTSEPPEPESAPGR